MDDPRQIDWFDLSRLLSGTTTQRSAARALVRLRIMELLADYTPALCGTVPLGCDLPTSDLDIACCAPRLPPFAEVLRAHFGDQPGFECRTEPLGGVRSVVARFRTGRRRIEVVGQELPIFRQRAFVHMLAEALLLQRAGPEAIGEVRRLKREGRTTEEAFGELFALAGDPYEALVAIYEREILGVRG